MKSWLKTFLEPFNTSSKKNQEFSYNCSCCGEVKIGIPSFDTQAPVQFYSIELKEQEHRCQLTTDTCVIDREYFFVKGCLEIPIIDIEEKLVINSWLSLSEKNFNLFLDLYEVANRDHHEPMGGWFSTSFWPYTDTSNLQGQIFFRNDGIRPLIRLVESNHPLSLAQRKGLTQDKLREICEYNLQCHPLN